MPVTNVKAEDVKDASYKPAEGIDQENYEMYDPQKFADAPVCVQLVGRYLQEEHLMAVGMAVDKAIKQ